MTVPGITRIKGCQPNVHALKQIAPQACPLGPLHRGKKPHANKLSDCSRTAGIIYAEDAAYISIYREE